jgi:tRNA G18 (ribose-2'-O)-methylase SpoU
MVAVLRVDDPADPRLDDFRDLTLADRRPDRPGGRGLVVAEGVPVVQRLLDSPYPIRAVMGVPAKIDALVPELSSLDIPAYVVSASTMDKVVGFHLNRGVLATADRAPVPDLVTVLARAQRVVVLEGVNDHENLGALFRNAAALGIDAVLLAERCADPLYRRSVRVSMGHVLRVPFVPEARLQDTLKALQDADFRILALTPQQPSVPLSRVDGSGRTALFVGAEGPGLSAAALEGADIRVRIPMPAGVDSLNVATAAAIAFYQLR